MVDQGVRYSIKWEDKGTLIEFSGDIEMIDIVNANVEQSTDDRYFKHSYSIWDFTSSTTHSIKTADTQHPASIDLAAGNVLKYFKLALVTSDGHTSSLLQDYISQCKKGQSPWQFKICSTVAEARQWCELES